MGNHNETGEVLEEAKLLFAQEGTYINSKVKNKSTVSTTLHEMPKPLKQKPGKHKTVNGVKNSTL